MKRCELCDRAAKMYCESDQASLCWDCDAKVHGANFLVERHPRVLLCRRCQAPTPWRATGARLSPIISACDRCTAIDKASPAVEEQDDNENEEQGDYQVVPRRLTPPPSASSSSGEESSSPSSEKASSKFLKRIRENSDLNSEVEKDRRCNFSQRIRLDLSIQPPFPSLFATDENDHRRSSLQSDAPLSADSVGAESRVFSRRASTAVDLTPSASCSPPI